MSTRTAKPTGRFLSSRIAETAARERMGALSGRLPLDMDHSSKPQRRHRATFSCAMALFYRLSMGNTCALEIPISNDAILRMIGRAFGIYKYAFFRRKKRDFRRERFTHEFVSAEERDSGQGNGKLTETRETAEGNGGRRSFLRYRVQPGCQAKCRQGGGLICYVSVPNVSLSRWEI